MPDKLKKILPLLWCLPGFLLWASFPPMGEKIDVLFALAPLMWLSRRAKAAVSARRWFLSGFIFWFATLSWMPAVVKNGGPWPLVVLGWGVLAAYCSAYFAAYGWLSAKFWEWARTPGGNGDASYWKRLLAVLVVEPVLWCGLELVRSRFGGGFAWNQLGVVPVNGGFAAPAALGGVYLLSAVVILVNGTVAGIVERAWKPAESGFSKLRRFGTLETVFAFALIWLVFQSADWAAPARAGESRDVKVALLQRNFPCVFDSDREDEDPVAVYNGLLRHPAYMRPDLVVLPESAMCEFGPVDQQGAVNFASWIGEKTGGAVLGGGSRYHDGKEYNSAALYSAGGDIQFYDKVHLVPFGEYIPGDKWITSLQKFAPVGSCTPGELKTLDFNGIRLGVAICYEDTDSAQLRRLAAMGAQMLVFITNDSWFSDSVEAEQHSWQAVARAVETGLTVVRCGNSGVTGVIEPDGKASWLCGADMRPLVDKSGAMCAKVTVPATVAPTFYVRFGDVPLAIAFLLLLSSMGAVKAVRMYNLRPGRFKTSD
jgi:apolipoprotein N-acyltransferase